MFRVRSSKSRDDLTSALHALRGAFLAVACFSLVINLLMLTPSLYMLQVYDRVLTSRHEVTLYMLSLVVVGLFALDALLEWVRARVLVRTGAALDLQLGPRVFDAYFERSLRVGNASQGQPLHDLTNIRQFLTGRGLFAFFDAPWMPIFVLVIFLLHPWLGAFAALAVLVLLGIAVANATFTAPVLDEANREAQVANHFANSHVRNAEVVDAMGMLANLRGRWMQRQGRMLALQAQASERGAVMASLSKFVRIFFQSGILGVGALLVIDNQLSPGGMIAASILLGRALAPVDLAIGTWRSLVSARGAHKRLGELLAAHPTRASKTSLPRPHGQVQAENLIVGSPGSRQPILKGLNFSAAPGMLVAIVGPSASGKSTLARALVGVWQPLSGAVRLGAAEVHSWNKEELGPWVGYLPQDVELFEGTVADNIGRFGLPNSEQTVLAAKRAGVHEMILRLPQGYETPVGQAGAALSGGQRQRIALARAMYGDPALLVLDEPNANLDQDGDTALIEALRAMKQEKRTVFVVTHRPNVLAVADTALILSGGVIQGFGPRDEVLKKLTSGSRPGQAEIKSSPAPTSKAEAA